MSLVLFNALPPVGGAVSLSRRRMRLCLSTVVCLVGVTHVGVCEFVWNESQTSTHSMPSCL